MGRGGEPFGAGTGLSPEDGLRRRLSPRAGRPIGLFPKVFDFGVESSDLMEDAVAVRRAALEAIADVEPEGLRVAIERHVEAGSTVPGVFTLHGVRAVAEGSSPVADGDGTLAETVATRAAGVQLIYDGLRLTRELVHEDPWDAGDEETADVDVLATDVLVARGFYLLARTEAAEAAVGVVRAFGRDQTVRREAADAGLDRNLEADVLELAAVAGATVAGGTAPPRLREFAAALAETPFPSASEFFAETDLDALATVATDAGGTEGVTTLGDQ